MDAFLLGHGVLCDFVQIKKVCECRFNKKQLTQKCSQNPKLLLLLDSVKTGSK